MTIYLDGKFCSERDAKVSVFDHGLLYGDGIFEGIRAYNGRVFKLKEHIDRLFYSAKAILLDIPLSHGEMMKAVVATCRRNKIRDGYIRLLVTRGVGTLGLNPNRCKNPPSSSLPARSSFIRPSFTKRAWRSSPSRRFATCTAR
jgi:branched-chain amino acid aminotransferase